MKSLQTTDILKVNGIKPSLHRIKILDYLIRERNHPTVDKIFQDISDDIPTLSKTTIYNTLKLFYEKNVVQILTIEENEAKYDAFVENHAHLKCNKCGSLYDLKINNKIMYLKSIEGHNITRSQLYFWGTCKNCLK